jgi:predicted DsbA family dithiol-disulfide isomerase
MNVVDQRAPITLDVWVDIACPWCFIGHRHLDAVLPRDSMANDDVVVVHRAYELQPNMPPRGKPAAGFFEELFGGAEKVAEIHERVAEVGRGVGIDFDFDAMPIVPSTTLAHRAITLVTDPLAQRRAVDALFSAYFEQGLDITDADVVADAVAAATGMDGNELSAALARGEGAETVAGDIAEARQLGISAVPTFVADMRVAVQGAQPPEVLKGLIDQARASA